MSFKHTISVLTIAFLMTFGAMAENIYQLETFGPVSTPEKAAETMKTAQKKVVASGGGVIIISDKVASGYEPESYTQPKMGAKAVTVLDLRKGSCRLVMPSLGFRRHLDPNGYSALSIDREINQPSFNIFGFNTTTRISDRVISGGVSYYQDVNAFEPCTNPEQMKVYPPTIRGLARGNVLNVQMGKQSVAFSEKRYTSTIEATITALGWDAKKRSPYLILQKKSPKTKWGKILNLFNKSSTRTLHIKEVTHCDLENAGTIGISKRNYGQGDNFGIGMRYEYMGNPMSTRADENGNAYSVDIWQMLDSFLGKVEKYDSEKSELTYTIDSDAAPSLGTSRPLINLTPSKWITKGKIVVESNPVEFNGINRKGYVKGVGTNWSKEIIGRYLAIDVPDEYAGNPAKGYWKGALHGRKVRRWWYVSGFKQLPSGEQRLWVQRVRYNVYDRAVPVLINEANYHRELSYIIAPGAVVADVSRAIPRENKHAIKARYIKASPSDKRIIVLGPTPDSSGKFAFEPGDKVEQAVCADPSHPVGFRVRHREAMPSNNGKSCSFESSNNGAYPIRAALGVNGWHDKMQVSTHSKYFNIIDVEASCDYGVRFRGEVKKAAVMMGQPQQRIAWKTPKGEVALSATSNRAFNVDAQGVTGVKSLSSGSKAGHNLRGIGVKLNAGKKEAFIKFTASEPDAAYSLTAQPNWICRWAVVSKTKDGFKVVFDVPAPAGAAIDWQLIR